MDTNKENELMHNLERAVNKSTAPYRADGVPLRPGVKWAAVNGPANDSDHTAKPATEAEAALARVTPEMVNRIEMYGAEAVYNAQEDN